MNAMTPPQTSLPARLLAAAAFLLAIAAIWAAPSSAESPKEAATDGTTPSAVRPAPPAGFGPAHIEVRQGD